MIRSMTGFGRADVQNENLRIRVEIRSVNHRFLEVSIRAPKSFSSLEHRVQELVQKRVNRGKVILTINLEGDRDSVVSLQLNEDLVNRYREIGDDLRANHGVSGDLDLATLLSLPIQLSMTVKR